MLKKIAVVYSKTGMRIQERGDGKISQVVKNTGADGLFFTIYQLAFLVTSKGIALFIDGQKFPIVDALYVRNKSGEKIASALLNKYCTLNKIIQINPFVMSPIGTKVLQYSELVGGGIDFPKTLYLTEWRKEAEELVQQYIGFPCILKSNSSYAGKDNYKINTIDELKEHMLIKNPANYVIQEYIFAPGDYRVLVLGGRAKVCEYRSRVELHAEHRNYGTKGFVETIIPLGSTPNKLLDDAQNTACILGFDIAGVDLIVSNKKNYFLECNSMPGIGGSKKNPQALLEYLQSLMK